jgi:biotin carboxylase
MSENKSIMILGAGILQLPAILKAKDMGLKVVALDMNSNAIGFEYSDTCLRISTIDIPKVVEAAKQYNVCGVMTLASDMPMRAVAHATKALGLPGISIETAEMATDKGKMIKAFKKHNVSSPSFYIVDDEKKLSQCFDMSYPCILKPVDNAGSRGVVLVESREELRKGFSYSKLHSKNGEVIIEDFMQGHEVSVETITVEGKTQVLAITDKLTSGPPHFVEMGHSQQSQLSEEMQEKIRELAILAVEAIGINIGPAHVEIMVTKNGPKLIELGARMGGDCITSHLVPLSTGINMIEATIDLLTGKKPDIKTKYNSGSAIRYFKAPLGKIESIIGIDEAKLVKGVKEITFIKNIGDDINDIHSSTDRIGYVVAQGKDAKEAIGICEDVMKLIEITTV